MLNCNHSEGAEKPMVHRISGLGDGERRRSLRFVADFASVGAFFSTLLEPRPLLGHVVIEH